MIVEGAYIELTNHHHQATTGAYTFGQALSLNGNTHYDRLLSMYFVEVNVQHVILYRVELNFLEHSLVVLAINVDVNEVDVGSVDELVDFLLAN